MKDKVKFNKQRPLTEAQKDNYVCAMKKDKNQIVLDWSFENIKNVVSHKTIENIIETQR